MFHPILDLKRPAGRLEMAFLVLEGLGLSFLLLYGLWLAVDLPMQNGEPWMFGAAGLLLQFAALVCLLIARRRGRRRERLRACGLPVRGRIVGVTCHTFVNYGNQRHPWTVLCEYQYEGQTYTVRSTFLWDRPRESGQTPKIFLDQTRPRRAWVDPESLQYEYRF